MKNNILEIFKNKNFALNGWLSIPNSFTAEAISKMGWDSITIDMQHGQNDYSTSISKISIFNREILVVISGQKEKPHSSSLIDLKILLSNNL